MSTISTGRVSYALAIAAVTAVAVVGSVWAAGNSQRSGISAEGIRINASTLLGSAEIAKLPVRQVDELF